MLHVGALIDRAPGRKYQAALSFAEFAPRAPFPRPATLASMRADLPADFVFALRAPRNSLASKQGTLRMDAELEAGLAWLFAAADALKARAVVLNTPADLTPGARSRELLKAFAQRLPRVPDRHYVWLPQGVWEPEDIAVVCAELGLLRGFDPLETAPTPGEVAYATLRAMGHRAGFSLTALSDALAATTRYATNEAFISVDADRAFDIARRLKGLQANLGDDAAQHGSELDDAAHEHDEHDTDEHDADAEDDEHEADDDDEA
jgi:uncharacterized protein YecE (DUF72 family)